MQGRSQQNWVVLYCSWDPAGERQPEILRVRLVWATGWLCRAQMEEVLHQPGEADSGFPPEPFAGPESPGCQGESFPLCTGLFGLS